MTDAEFISEVRRGLLMIMRAFMRRFGLTWVDFLPRDVLRPMTWTEQPVDELLKQA